MNDVTRILQAIADGRPQAAEELLPLVYDELRRLAAQRLAHEKPGQTLQPTALVHEAYLRLARAEGERRWDTCGHFFAAAAEAMRRILVESARRKHRLKRGGDRSRIDLEHAEASSTAPSEDLLAIDEALDRLAEEDPRKAELVKLRFFAGLAAAFHLDRMLAYLPGRRDALLRLRTEYLETTLKQDPTNAAARLLLARTAWHDPSLGPKEASGLLPANDESPMARRTRAGLLLRQGKADEAIAVLEAASKDRNSADDRPPVEELLLAWAYRDTNHADKAAALRKEAQKWLDRVQKPVWAANLIAAQGDGIGAALAPLFLPTSDPRYDSFDWETWHELDVLLGEPASMPPAKRS